MTNEEWAQRVSDFEQRRTAFEQSVRLFGECIRVIGEQLERIRHLAAMRHEQQHRRPERHLQVEA